MTDKDRVGGNSRRDILKGAGYALAGSSLVACANGDTPDGEALTGDKNPLARALPSAEQLAGVTYTDAERAQMVSELEGRLDTITQLRAQNLPNTLAPAQVFDPRLPGRSYRLDQPGGVKPRPATLGAKPGAKDVAFATIGQLGAWLRSGVITSRFITDVYLARIAEHDGTLEAFVTVLPERARAEADAADAERAAGQVRGPLHGIPYAVKDLFDADGGPTTWGAAPYASRQGKGDAAIVRKLSDAGAILLGKTTCGALAYGDIWFGGVTRNPFDPREGSSGSSAGSASATAAGLCAFAIGTETLGSLVSPSMRCGTTTLRPTFGRVSRAGGMALCWSLDKVGPIARCVDDCALVMEAINGQDPDDPASLAAGFSYDSGLDLSQLRLGIAPEWRAAASDVERAAMDAAIRLGASVTDFAVPELPSAPLVQQLLAEAAAAFEELTLTNRDDDMVWQDDAAWPNSFRAARFLSAVDLVQIDRLRRKWMLAMADAFETVDVVIGPSYSSGMLTPTNFTGHPCLAVRCGFEDTRPRTLFDTDAEPDAPTARTPVAISLWAPLFEDGTLLSFGRALEDALGVATDTPPGF